MIISIHSIILPIQNLKIGAVKPSRDETLCECVQNLGVLKLKKRGMRSNWSVLETLHVQPATAICDVLKLQMRNKLGPNYCIVYTKRQRSEAQQYKYNQRNASSNIHQRADCSKCNDEIPIVADTTAQQHPTPKIKKKKHRRTCCPKRRRTP
jgi:hypothetical protein